MKDEIKLLFHCIKYMRQDAAQQKDEEIVRLVQLGKVEFFSILIERYEDKMKRYGQKFLSDKEDIKDVVQEIFLKTYENIKSFDLERKFSSWLYRIAHNELVNALKKRRRSPLSLFDLDILFPQFFHHNNVNQEIERRDKKEIIGKCLDELEPKYREPIVLHYFEDLSYQEISEVLQVPVSTVGIRIKRAKEKLKSIYEKTGYKSY